MFSNTSFRLNLPVKFLLLIIVLGFVSNAQAQRRRTPGINYDGDFLGGSRRGSGGGSSGGTGYGSMQWGVALSTGYDVPVGDFSKTYKPAPAFGIHVLYNENNFIFNASVGYHAYSPKYYKVFVDEANHDFGYFERSSFKVYSIYGGLVYNLKPTETLNFYGGINGGIYYVSYSVYTEINTPEQNLTSDIGVAEKNVYIAPKLGLMYQMGGNIGLGLEGKYNIFTPEGTSNSRTGSDVSGSTLSSYALQANIIYHF